MDDAHASGNRDNSRKKRVQLRRLTTEGRRSHYSTIERPARPIASGEGAEAIALGRIAHRANPEVTMTKPPKPSLAADKIDTSGLKLSLRHIRGPHTDPIDMDQLFLVDPEIARKVTVVRLEADAKIHQTMADATSAAAKLLKSGG
jgi:hypothetical protein